MTDGHNLVRIFFGSIVEVEYFRERLEEIGISSFVKDDFQSGIHAGIPTGSPDSVELLVEENQAEKALKLIRKFQTEEE